MKVSYQLFGLCFLGRYEFTVSDHWREIGSKAKWWHGIQLFWCIHEGVDEYFSIFQQ